MRKTAESIEEIKAQRDTPENSQTVKRKGRGDASRIAQWQFKPGQSGNPGGRRKHDVAAEIARAIIENNAEEAYKGLAKALCKGNAYVFKELAERGYGKLKETVEHAMDDRLLERLAAGRKRAASE